MNSFGTRLRLTVFGESHGPAIGGVLDGVPAGMPIDMVAVQTRLNQRRPGADGLVSARKESDELEILSGVHNGRATGAPLAFIIRNQDARPKDYDAVTKVPRPGHSDLVAHQWARGHNDPRGGGHYSGRLTACMVAAAALVEPFLDRCNITVGAHLQQVGDIVGDSPLANAKTIQESVAQSKVHTADAAIESAFIQRIEAARADKNSVGGVVAWLAEGVPACLGAPLMDSVESMLAHLMFAIPAVKGVSFGEGFTAAAMSGTDHNDAYHMVGDGPTSKTNHAGGILGGRTTGESLWGHVAIKPASSIFQTQSSVNLETGADEELELKGRHDPCIAIRAVPVVRAAVEFVLADFALQAIQEGHISQDVLLWD